MNCLERKECIGDRMDIALITPGRMPLPPAKCTSIEIYVYELAKQLAENNNVRLFTWGRPRGSIVRDGITVNKIYPVNSARIYLRSVLQDLTKKPPSIIQIDNRPYYAPPFRRNLSTPLVLNIHSTTFISPDIVQPDILKRCFESANAIVVCSKFLKNEIEGRFEQFSDKIHVIYSGADIGQFPSRYSMEGQQERNEMRQQLLVEDKTVFAYVGRFVPRKGITLLLQSFSKVAKQFPNTELWIIGGQPWNMGNPFHNKVRKLSEGLPVKFIPFVPHKVLYKYYLAADLLICPSQLSEGFPLVNIEAASCGLPALGSDNWGIKEGIAEGINGWRIKDYTNPDSWSRMLCIMASRPDVLQKTGIKARLWAEKNFTWKRVANDFESLYKSLL